MTLSYDKVKGSVVPTGFEPVAYCLKDNSLSGLGYGTIIYSDCFESQSTHKYRMSYPT